MKPFELVTSRTSTEALAQHQETDGEGAYYAGGTEILLVLKEGFAEYNRLVDVKTIPELTDLSQPSPNVLRIGAAVTHRTLERSELAAKLVPLIPYVEHDVANIRVRSSGTIGGNLCFGEPHSDMGLLSLLVEATMNIQSADGTRLVPANEFFQGAYETAVEPGELLLSLDVPVFRAGTRFGYQRFRFHERPSCNAGVVLIPSADGETCERAVVGAGAAGPIPFRSAKAEALFAGQPWDVVAKRAAEAGEVVAAESEPLEDLTGSVEYKRHLIAVFVKRATLEAVAQGKGR